MLQVLKTGLDMGQDHQRSFLKVRSAAVNGGSGSADGAMGAVPQRHAVIDYDDFSNNRTAYAAEVISTRLGRL